MFSSLSPDTKQRRSPRFPPKPNEPPINPIVERPHTAFANSYGADDLKNRLPTNTLKGMKVLWRQSQMAQSLRVRPNRDGQMPVEKLSDTSESSDDSPPNLVENKQRAGKQKKRHQKVAGGDVKKPELCVAPQEAKLVNTKKEVADVAVQAMRPASINALVEGRLNMLESRLRLEEMRSKSWCVRMTEAEDSVKQLQAQVKALSAGVNGTGTTQNRFVSIPTKERGLWPSNFAEGRKTQVTPKTSQLFDKDFTSEFHAILQQIRKDNELEESVGDFCADTKN